MNVPVDPATHFAVVRLGGEIRLYSESPGGMRAYASSDGVRWQASALPREEARKLTPFGATSHKDEAHLFCLDEDRAIVPVRGLEGGLAAGEPFSFMDAPDPWYAAPPEPDEADILWREDEGTWRVFFPGRRSRGRDADRLACIGTATSPDLRTWRMEPPILAPNRYPAMHAPHVFEHEGRTALCYATPDPTGFRTLRCALAARPQGPYEILQDDLLAGDCRCTVKTVATPGALLAFFGKRNPRHVQVMTIGRPARVGRQATGKPVFCFHASLLQLMGRPLLATDATLESRETLVRVIQRHGGNFRLTARVESADADAVAVLIRANMAGSDNVAVWLDFHRNCIEARRGVAGRTIARAPYDLTPARPYRLMLWAEGPFVDVYVNDELVLSAPTEALLSGGFGLAVRGGRAAFAPLEAHTLAP
jgi:hypothetical protein